MADVRSDLEFANRCRRHARTVTAYWLLISGINRPLIMRVTGSDGRVYKQLSERCCAAREHALGIIMVFAQSNPTTTCARTL